MIDPTRVQAICFDVDGTLSDTDDQLVEKLARFLKPIQILFPRAEIASFSRRFVMAVEAPGNFLIGLPDRIGWDDEIFSLVDRISRSTQSKPRVQKVIPGIQGMLAELHQHYPLAVVSARDERTTRMFLDSSELTPYFKCIATALTCPHTKPFPDSILWAAEKMKVPADACLMVGDTVVDIRAGNSAGAQTVGVLCGFGEQEELVRNGTGMILKTTADLVGLLSNPSATDRHDGRISS